MNKQEAIDRCIALEQEYDNLEEIHLSSEDIEDVSDAYQAKLELGWFKDELCGEYKELNNFLGFPNRRLYPKSKRRI